MEFQNAGIDTSLLPKAEELVLEPIDPNYRKVLWREWLAGWFLFGIAIAIVLLFMEPIHDPIWIAAISAGFVLLALSNWIVIIRSFHYKAYALREHDIVYRSGYLVRSTRICPFNRIQHCSVDIGFIERKFGLASLSLFTAGGNQADMKIPGLKEEDAAAMREFITRKIGEDGSSA